MKFVMDERVKNRLTGILVIISIAVIFLPAMMKKSNHRFDENVNVSLKLPAKPSLPKVAIPNQQTLFKTVKVAHIDIPVIPHVQRTSQLAKAEPLAPLPSSKINSSKVVKPVEIAKTTPIKSAPVATKTAPLKLTATNSNKQKEMFAVQLASFTQQDNAKLLVARLKQQGYSATYNRLTNKQGTFYQVLVGQMNQKDEAMVLQKKLVANMQLSGFVVRTGGIG